MERNTDAHDAHAWRRFGRWTDERAPSGRILGDVERSANPVRPQLLQQQFYCKHCHELYALAISMALLHYSTVMVTYSTRWRDVW